MKQELFLWALKCGSSRLKLSFFIKHKDRTVLHQSSNSGHVSISKFSSIFKKYLIEKEKWGQQIQSEHLQKNVITFLFCKIFKSLCEFARQKHVNMASETKDQAALQVITVVESGKTTPRRWKTKLEFWPKLEKMSVACAHTSDVLSLVSGTNTQTHSLNTWGYYA